MLCEYLSGGKTAVDLDDNVLKHRVHLSYHLLHLDTASHRVSNAVYHKQHNSELFVTLGSVVVINIVLSVLTLKKSVVILLLSVGVEVVIVS